MLGARAHGHTGDALFPCPRSASVGSGRAGVGVGLSLKDRLSEPPSGERQAEVRLAATVSLDPWAELPPPLACGPQPPFFLWINLKRIGRGKGQQLRPCSFCQTQ